MSLRNVEPQSLEGLNDHVEVSGGWGWLSGSNQLQLVSLNDEEV
jgi:hypothetical protein